MTASRRSGILVPLFSLTSSQSWGVGEFLDLPVFAGWLRAANQAFVQILPITEVPEFETSPYSALTAMALETRHISLPALEDFVALGGEAALPEADRATLAHVRATPRIAHRDVRTLKTRWLRASHARFREAEEGRATDRSRRFEQFCRDHAAWLDDYALFRALRLRAERQPWWEWPAPLARRDDAAIERTRVEMADEIDYRKYAQWVAAEQWSEARRLCRPLQVLGDVPFMISSDSPDVWSRQDEFRFDSTVGVPPDAFSETGQDWGLPPLRWDVMAANDFAWIRERAARTAELFDGFRLDHLVGLYRTYIRPLDSTLEPYFSPSDEAAQTALGETLVSIYAETGAEVIAEDLGTVPDFVRASLVRLGVAGYKVMRWERRWLEPDQRYIDPSEYDVNSVATTGTHDTDSLVTWWEELSAAEQQDVRNMRAVAARLADARTPLDALVRALLDARSQIAILPIQDVFGWPDRINTPAQVSDDNWSWIVPWHVDELLEIPEARERAETLGRWTREAGRAI